MYDSDGAELHECANCGAQLPAPDAQGNRTCTFCHSVYSVPAPAPVAPPQINLHIDAPDYARLAQQSHDYSEFTPINEPKSGHGCLYALVVIVLIAATLGGGAYWAVQSGKIDVYNVFKPSYTFQDQMLLIPGGEPSAAQPFVVVASRYDNGTVDEVLRFNGKDAKPVWVSSKLSDVSTSSGISADANNVYVVGKTKLYALKLTDGTIAWQAALSDEENGCKDCLSSIDKYVIVKTKDGTLQAFDQATGAPSWSRHFVSTSSTIVRVGSHLIVVDGAAVAATPTGPSGPRRRGSGSDTVVSTIDLSTGNDAVVIDAVCAPPKGSSENRPSMSDEFVATPAGDGIVIMYGSSPVCMQSFDPATGAMQWGVFADRTQFDTSKMSVVNDPAGLVIGDENGIGIVGADRAAFRDLGSEKTKNYLPIGVAGPLVIAEVVTNRGTPKTSIVGIDAVSGQTKWETSFGKAKGVDAQNASWSTWSSNMNKDGTFTARVSGNKVYVVTAVEDGTYSDHVAVDSIDATTGRPGEHSQFDAESHDLIPSFGPPLWSGAKVLTRVGDDTIQLIDATTGKRVSKV